MYNKKGNFFNKRGKRMEEQKQRSAFTNKLGFVLAAAGSAVGLGDVYKRQSPRTAVIF